MPSSARRGKRWAALAEYRSLGDTYPMPTRERQLLATIARRLREVDRAQVGANDAAVLDSTIRYLEDRLIPATRTPKDIGWETFLSFWPPRLLRAYDSDALICFFGAGLSMATGLPSWTAMLRDYFGLDAAVMSDENADALTQAELASHRLGAEKVQRVLREKLGVERPAATNHFLAAALRLPFYVTTNYDTLFEKAWRAVGDEVPLIVITNDANFTDAFPSGSVSVAPDKAYLFKLHGSIASHDEHLILTRSDYRRHYRSNTAFFRATSDLLRRSHVLFLGFGHQDPEVTRLVEDAIWGYEKAEEDFARADAEAKEQGAAEPNPPPRPNFYSLQFNMRLQTPEIFAARGIVALEPPLADPTIADTRSSSLGRGLLDLIGASQLDLADKLTLDSLLDDLQIAIASSIDSTLARLSLRHADACDACERKSSTPSWVNQLLDELGELAGQGVYLVNRQGELVHCALPRALTNAKRRIGPPEGFAERPYFRQATTYRKPFVSDSFRSRFNTNSTIAFCLPLLSKTGGMRGLLFTACQIGSWMLPLTVARKIWSARKTASVLLIDSNGIALFPPNDEFSEEGSRDVEGGETATGNVGFSFDRLVALSRRDRLIGRVMENVVPLRQDDDVISLGLDAKQYSVMTELRVARWKIAISEPVLLSQNV